MKRSCLVLTLSCSLGFLHGCGGGGYNGGNNGGGGGTQQRVAQLTVTAAPNVATTGIPISLTVTAVDSAGAVVTSYTGTVRLTSSDPQASFQPSYSLTLGGGVGSASVTFKTLGNQTVTATDVVTTSLKGTSGGINVVSNAATHLSVTPNVLPVTARQTFGLNVNALDAANNVATSYNGTVQFSSTDKNAHLLASATLVAGSSSNLYATFETTGTQTITATDTSSASITGSMSTNVNAPAALTISSKSPPAGMVGTNYGIIGYATCHLSYNRGPHYVCQPPCAPGPGCGPGPICNFFNIQCVEAIHFEFTATGAVQPYTWSASALPSGLSLTNSVILGTPTSPNTYNITVTATDSGNPSVQTTANYAITINNPNPPVVKTTPVPPPGVVGKSYGGANGFAFSASGCQTPPICQPLTWSEPGPLPPGLTFSTSGVLSGIPNAPTASPMTITVTATDQFGTHSAGVNFNLVVSQHGFQETSSMTAQRNLHTATLLGTATTSKVLVAGGQFDGTHLLASAELFDPPTGNFVSTSSMRLSRSAHTATLLNDGRVLVAGGSTGSQGNPTATAELYDATAGSFSLTTADMQTARYGHTATLLNNGSVLVIGGADATGTALASAEVFDPTKATFAATGSMQTARHGHTAALLADGTVLVTGGIDASSKHLATAELYDPNKGTFTAVTGMMSVTRANHTATLFTAGPDAGRVLLAGGVDDAGAARNTAELYDPTAESFTATTNMVSAHANHTATLLADGTVLLAGGVDATGSTSAVVELFTPAAGAGSFAATGSLVTAREQHAATLLANGHVLATGGSEGSIALASAEVYQ